MADNQNNVVLCELLAYVKCYRSRSTEFNIKQAVLRWFNAEDISGARSSLEENVKTLIPNFPHFGKKRTDSANRSAREVMVSDILEMFKYLDAIQDHSKIPIFAAVDMAKIPPASPESAADIMSLMETLSMQQRQLTQLQETITQMRKDVNSNTSEIERKNHNTLPNCERTSGASGGGRPGEPCESKKSCGRNTATEVAPRIESKITDSIQGKDSNKNDAERHPSFAQKAKEASSEPNSFQFPAKRPNKGSNKGAGFSRTKAPRICGTSKTESFKAGPSTIQVQLTNVNSQTTSENIEDYIKSVKDSSVAAVKIEDKSSAGWDTKRYVVTFNYEHLDSVMSPDFWPEEIYIKRWFPARTPSQKTPSQRT